MGMQIAITGAVIFIATYIMAALGPTASTATRQYALVMTLSLFGGLAAAAPGAIMWTWGL